MVAETFRRTIRRYVAAIGPLALAALTLVVFGDLLFSDGHRVVSHIGTDLQRQFLAWRQFGFGQLRQGNLALWNPYVFGGAPFFGGFQSALLYPPNWLHLVLPLGVAINWIVALHVYLMGLFVYFWARFWKMSRCAATLAGAMAMFGGPFFMHVFAGHLPNLCTMVWVPLVLLAIDGLATESGSALRWILLGIGAAAMQVFAGHVQYVYYTALMAGAYAVIRCIASRQRMRIVLGSVGIALGAFLLAAVQILSGMQASAESFRGGGLPLSIAETFSLRPSNLLTMLSPYFLGDPFGQMYLGSPSDFWEMMLFVSIGGLILAAMGAAASRGWRRWTLLAMAALALAAAFGRFTPVYPLLWKVLPGYDDFRGTSKFVFFFLLFVAMLAGLGLDWLIQSCRRPVRTAMPVLVVAVGLWIAPSLLRRSADGGSAGLWGRFIGQCARFGEDASSPYDAFWYQDPRIVHFSGHFAAGWIWPAAAATTLAAALLFTMRWKRSAGYGLALLAGLELLIFARANVPTIGDGPPPEAQIVQREDCSGPGRVLAMGELANWGPVLGYKNLMGDDPMIPKRYIELFLYSERCDPDQSTMPSLAMVVHSPLMALFRCRSVYTPDYLRIPMPDRTLDPVQIVSDFQVITDRDEMFHALSSPSFDLHHTVILEDEPQPPPEKSAAGTCSVVKSWTDGMEIKAVLSGAGILFITENYSRGWQVTDLDRPEAKFKLMPADYALMALPLGAGTHRLRIEYSPWGFRVGRWISLAALVFYILLVLNLARRSVGRASSDSTPG